MTIFYMDMVNGNDANTGLSWAQAWKTGAGGPTIARIAAGDTIRFAKTPDPVSIGTATWTNQKIGNSITFDTAPTKSLTNCESGWVKTDSGNTVTNNQTTAYIGGNGAVSVLTSSSQNLAYCNLGAVKDLSGYQIINFWFRPGAAYDCTTTQNMFIRLCSDTLGATVVNTITMPKWNYSANTWYPIVIDAGSAFGSSIQSISITQSVATSAATHYFDEFFVSPAAGITLNSMIGPTSTAIAAELYPIKYIRDADVWLMSSFTPGTAAQAYTGANDVAWVGTTGNYATYKRDALQLFGVTGPNAGALSYLITVKAGSYLLPITYSGGWNTSTTIQDGETWFDGVTQGSSGFVNSNPYSSIRLENFGYFRMTTNMGSGGTSNPKYTNLSFVASFVGFNGNNYNWQTPDNNNVSFGSITGCPGGAVLGFSATSSYTGANVTFGTIWGNGNGSGVTGLSNGTLTINKCGSACSNVGITFDGENNVINIGSAYNCKSAQYTTGAPYEIFGPAVNYNSVINIGPVQTYNPSQGILSFGGATYNNTFNFTGSNTISGFVFNTALTRVPFNNVINGLTGASSNLLAPTAGTTGNSNANKMYFNQLNGGNTVILTTAFSGIFRNDTYWELQAIDVHTAGSKAWKLYVANVNQNTTTNASYITENLKLASVAAVANKLVTVTCWVKRSSAVNVGIRMPGVQRFVAGYTTNQDVLASGTINAYEQLTLTFTPTADCVFDIEAIASSPTAILFDAVWDDLVITQAA